MAFFWHSETTGTCPRKRKSQRATQMVCFITWSIQMMMGGTMRRRSDEKPNKSSVTEKAAAAGQIRHRLKCTHATKRRASSHSKNRCSKVSSSALQKQRGSTEVMLKRVPNREPVYRTPCAICQFKSMTSLLNGQRCN